MAKGNDGSQFMLPRLKKSSIRQRGIGLWNRQPLSALNDVARSIDVNVSIDVTNVSSIPSMWARPLALESILPNSEYNDRIRIPLINQWRGMLTAIALAPDFEKVGKITAQLIDLTDPRYRNNKFIQSLVRLAPSPENCLFDLPHNLNPWLKGYVFRWNNKAIGITSPSTIVCPAEDSDWSGLPWFIDEQVRSPEKYLSQYQKSRLSLWLVHLRQKISENGKDFGNQISWLINDFINDLGGKLEQSLNSETDLVATEIYFGNRIELGIYNTINRPLRNPRQEILNDTFLPDLYFLRRPDAFPNANLPESVKNLSFGGAPISLILPIQSSFFNHLDAANLLSKLKVERLRAGTALKLSMQVDGHLVEREYELKYENAINGLPVAEIWPNFVHPDWKIYYAYSFLDIDDEKLKLEFPNVSSTTEDTHTFGRSKLFRFTTFPNHVVALYDSQTVGCIPLKVPEPFAVNNFEWTVGVDFGTSFTNVYKKHDDFDEKISFEGLHYQITTCDNITRIYALEENFIPLIQDLPIASLLTEKDGRNKVGSKTTKTDVIFDARIYNLQDITQAGDIQKFLIGNLKWSRFNDKKPMRLFIEQLALQISAQAVKNGVTNIQWILSYPTAFSPTDKKSYVKIWNDCLKKLADITGLRFEDLSVSAIKHFRSESLAIAHFFHNKKEKTLSNTACIDIGGGTTDISIWELRNKVFTPIFQVSLQLSVRHLFSDIIKRSPRFLRHIRFTTEEYTDALLQFSKKNKGDLFYGALDSVVKGGSEIWLNEHRENLQNDERLRDYLQILMIGIAGIHYYIGLILNVLHREDNRLYDSGKPVNVYFGGNGCRLLNWLSYTGKFGDDEVSNLFQEMVVNGSQFKPSSRTVYLSEIPEEEVACGLVVGKKKLGDPSINENALIPGEPCRIGEHSFGWSDYIQFNEDVEENIDELQVEELVNLPQFLYWFHKSLRSKKNDINVPAIDGYKLGDPKKTDEENLANTFENNLDFWESVIEQLQDSIVLEDGLTSETIRLEPPFILGLKALIEVLSRRWARKYEKL
jgi:hypothetical protein